jgi:hypothetical protein
MRGKSTIIQRTEKSRLKMVGACKPDACSRRDGPCTGFDDRNNAIGVEKVITHPSAAL